MKLEDVSIHAWLQNQHIVTETGQPIDLSSHKFLFQPYRDFSPQQVCMKAAQIGFSTLSILKTLWIAKKRGLDIIYTLPSANDVKDFVGGKVNRIIAHNQGLQEWTNDKDSIEQKHVGNHAIYYRGSWVERAALMVSADLLVEDEYDRSKVEILEMYGSRLQHSQFKWRWVFSNPSATDFGVHALWKQSDQKHWFIRCLKCEKEQYLSWPDSIDAEQREFVCKYCHAVLSSEERRRGRWVAKYENKDWSGYWISLLMAPWVTADQILKYEKEKSVEYFANFVLGIPYVGKGNKLTQEALFGNLTDVVNSQEGRIVIGVDTGAKISLVCGNKEGLFYYNESKDYQELERLLRRWPNSVAIIDEGGDIISPRKLREKYPGRVFLCHFSTDRKTMQLIRWGENDEQGHVLADRNRLIQLVVDEFTDRRIPLYGTKEDWHDYWVHWSHMYRLGEEDGLGVMRYKWERNGADHLGLATVYWRIGMDRFGKGSVSIIGKSSPLPSRVGVELSPTGTMPSPIRKREYVMPSNESDDWREV